MDSKRLNEDQSKIFEIIQSSLNKRAGQDGLMFFVEGPAGSGKSYLLNAIKNYAEDSGFIVRSVASTAVAAVPLGGVTAHSLFGLQRDTPPTESSITFDHEYNPRATLLITTDLFIWDNISMSEDSHLNKADVLLRKLTNNNIPFGGKKIVFAGDKRGLLPPGKSLQCAFLWSLWSQVQKYSLTKNMRIDPTHSKYAAEVLEIGDPSSAVKGYVQLDSEMIVDSLDTLIAETFSGCFEGESPADTFGRVILTQTNEESRRLNDKILKLLRKEKPVTHLDTFKEGKQFDVEYISQLCSLISGLPRPPDELVLKPGADVILTTNVDIERGLTNGTVLSVNEISDDWFTGTIRNGPFAGQTATIHKVFQQFPVCLRYAATIYKAQGQTFDKVGVYLRSYSGKPEDSIFDHRQLYTALSRVRSKNDILVFFDPDLRKCDASSRKISIRTTVDEKSCFVSQIATASDQTQLYGQEQLYK